jgi:hypothetical protein
MFEPDREAMDLAQYDPTSLPGFVATQHELIHLLRYWTRESINNSWPLEMEVKGEDARHDYRDERIVTISRLLGPEISHRVIQEVEDQYRKSDPVMFEVYKAVTDEEMNYNLMEEIRGADGIDQRVIDDAVQKFANEGRSLLGTVLLQELGRFFADPQPFAVAVRKMLINWKCTGRNVENLCKLGPLN